MPDADNLLPDDPDALRGIIRTALEKIQSLRDELAAPRARVREAHERARNYREQCEAVWSVYREMDLFWRGLPEGPKALESRCFGLQAENQELKDENARLRREIRILERQLAEAENRTEDIKEGERYARAVTNAYLAGTQWDSVNALLRYLNEWAEGRFPPSASTSIPTIRRRLKDAGVLCSDVQATVERCLRARF
jgi:chromosome segregation ATPase